MNYPAVSPSGQTTLLYDLATDIGERENVAEDHPEVVERMEAELAIWSSGLAEPMWPSTRSTLDTRDGQTIQLYF